MSLWTLIAVTDTVLDQAKSAYKENIVAFLPNYFRAHSLETLQPLYTTKTKHLKN